MLDGAVGQEAQMQVQRHQTAEKRNRQDQLDPVADEKDAGKQAKRGGIEDLGDQQLLGGVVPETPAVGRRRVRVVEVAQLGEALGGHEERPEHPVRQHQRDGRDQETADPVPAQEQAQRIVHGFRQDIQVDPVLRAQGADVIDEAHDQKRQGHEEERQVDPPAERQAGRRQERPLRPCPGGVNPAGRGGPKPFVRMMAILRGVEPLVDRVIARTDEAGGDQTPSDLCQGVQRVVGRAGQPAQQHTREHERVLEPVVGPCNSHVVEAGPRRPGAGGGAARCVCRRISEGTRLAGAGRYAAGSGADD
jgi:hypothetical protein